MYRDIQKMNQKEIYLEKNARNFSGSFSSFVAVQQSFKAAAPSLICVGM